MASSSRAKRPRQKRQGGNVVRELVNIPAPNVLAPPEIDTYGIIFTSPEHLARFQKLSGRVISPTKFCDFNALDTLGISIGVRKLFQNLGWHSFLNLRHYTYRAFTLEFLSLLSANPIDGIDFRLLNVDRHLSTEQLSDIFGFTQSGDYCPKDHIPRYFHDTEFWQAISGRNELFESRRAKATRIRHPVMRLAHRILSSTICARQDAGTVTRYELYILWCMTDPVGIHRQYFPDGVKCILDKFYRAQESTTGDICFGGLITLLATRPPLLLSIPTGWNSVSTAGSIDLLYLCTRAHMIEPTSEEDKFYWLIDHERHPVTLPSPLAEIEEVTPTTNWTFLDPGRPPEDEDHMIEPPPAFDLPAFASRMDAFAANITTTVGQILRNQERILQYLYDQGHLQPPSDPP